MLVLLVLLLEVPVVLVLLVVALVLVLLLLVAVVPVLVVLLVLLLTHANQRRERCVDQSGGRTAQLRNGQSTPHYDIIRRISAVNSLSNPLEDSGQLTTERRCSSAARRRSRSPRTIRCWRSTHIYYIHT